MKIAHLSDFHFTWGCLNPLKLSAKRALGLLNWFFWRKCDFDYRRLACLPECFSRLGVEKILVAGDLTTTSLAKEFETAAAFLAAFPQPKLVIPGNHDHYTKGAYRKQRFYQLFTNRRTGIEHPSEFFCLKDHGVEAHRLDGWGWCVALDTARPNPLSLSNGYFTEEVDRNLREILSLLPPNEPILLMNHFPFLANDEPSHILLEGDNLKAILEQDRRIKLYLHGHTHRHILADLQQASLPVVLDAGCIVQKSHGTWNLIDLTPDGCRIEAYRWEETEWKPWRTESIAWSRA